MNAVKDIVMPSLQEFYDMLEAHDWYYAFSDAHNVWLAGEAARDKLNTIAEAGGSEYKKLLKKYSKHMFTGESWGNKQAPKPRRPQ